MSNTTALIPEQIDWHLGIDISKEWLDCHLRPGGAALHCDNNADGFARLHRWLSDQGATPDSTIICMENTGIYGKRLLAAMTDYGWLCAVEKTTITDKVGPEHHRKEDVYDAELVAEYADRFTDTLHPQWPAEAEIEALSRLYAERRRLVRQRASTKTKQTQAAQYPTGSELLSDSWQQQLGFYNEQIDRLENRMHQIVSGHEGLARYYELLTSIPGVAKATGWLWLILFYGQASLDPKKISSRFGFAPHSNRSGTSTNGKTRSSGHGVSEMRSTMSLAVRSASTHCTKFKSYKQKKESEDRCWPVIRNNLINKLIKIMCAIWNSQTPYDPDHTSRFDRQKKSA